MKGFPVCVCSWNKCYPLYNVRYTLLVTIAPTEMLILKSVKFISCVNKAKSFSQIWIDNCISDQQQNGLMSNVAQLQIVLT